MRAKRVRSSIASTKRWIKSAWALCHSSVRSFCMRLRKLSYSAASRRYRSLSCASSASRRVTAPSGGSTRAPEAAASGVWLDGVSCSERSGSGCVSLSSIVGGPDSQSPCRPTSAVLTGFSVDHIQNSLPGNKIAGRYLLRHERQDVPHDALPLRIVQDLMIHLRIPPDLHRSLEPVGEGAGEVAIHDAVFAGQQEQQRGLDAVRVGGDGALRPLDLAPRAGRHDAVHARVFGVGAIHRGIAAQMLGIDARADRKGRPEVGEQPRADELPEGRPKGEAEPRAADYAGGDRVARLRLQVTQRDQAAERQPEDDLRAGSPRPHDAPERLQVAQQLAEAGQMPPPPARP